jgi:Flp pilus assembly protein TadG
MTFCRTKNYSKRQKGQAMIEFALSIMFLLLILFSVLYFGRYFLISQVLLFAAQEGAKIAARTPNLSDNTTRDMVRGFSTNGAETNPNSVIYTALASAGLLSQPVSGSTPPTSGNMPPGSSIQILPWDAGSTNTIPPGTVAVVITYPFELVGNPFTGASSNPVKSVALAMSFSQPPIQFPNFNISQQAVAAEEVYQQ